MINENIDPKIKANAISAYLMIFVSLLFLFNKDNKYLNNDFVKSHTKTAFVIHLWFLLNYIIFVSFWLWASFGIFGFSLNLIIATIFFLALFFFLLFWMYKAQSWYYYKIGELFKTVKIDKIVELNSSFNISEKDKLSIILSYVPILWYIVNWKYYKNNIIKNNIKINSYSFFVICLFYIFWDYSLSTLFLLFYIIFWVFSSLNLIINNKLIDINLSFLPSMSDLYLYYLSLRDYLSNYFKSKDFVPFLDVFKNRKEKYTKEELILEKELSKNKDLWKHSFLIYVPIFNFYFLRHLNSRFKIHIWNGFVISLVFIVLFFVSKEYILLLLFPLFFWTWYLKTRLAYKMPFLYFLFEMFISSCIFIKNSFTKAKKIKNTKKEVTLKVENKESKESDWKSSK